MSYRIANCIKIIYNMLSNVMQLVNFLMMKMHRSFKIFSQRLISLLVPFNLLYVISAYMHIFLIVHNLFHLNLKQTVLPEGEEFLCAFYVPGR